MKYTALTLSLFSLFIILQNTACTHANKYPKETQMLDSMQVFVVKADSAVKAIDLAKIAGYINQVQKDNEIIRLMNLDSMSAGATAIFRNLNAARWALMGVTGKRGPLITELERSQKQLNHLSHDLKHNLVNADSVGLYVAFETKKASELVQVANICANDVTREVPVYTMFSPKADSLFALLKGHKKL